MVPRAPVGWTAHPGVGGLLCLLGKSPLCVLPPWGRGWGFLGVSRVEAGSPVPVLWHQLASLSAPIEGALPNAL